MNKFHIVAAVMALLAAPTTFADEEAETLTREQVQAEGRESIRNGILSSGEISFWEPTASTHDRAPIAAEGREAMRLGLFDDGEGTRVSTAEERRHVRRAGESALTRDAEGSGR